ncbi:MAG: ATP synthase F1 subunit delta [Candidatus Loosdrechtia sp.]|uniref:F0F1 ATP synthase subunit delta n=1 Tax=Candidatus Loosdrechtia sp. TaxID=3101272 RepID=UPI003A75DDD7|nr:MAG: ATP synthase F1 subunit delta [Candidatus Jettenia sp. AMX2]
MLDKSVAITFVNALADVALKRGRFEQIEKDLEVVSDVITGNDNLKKVLFHPTIPRDDKKKVIGNVFDGLVSDLIKNFLYLLVDRRRERILEFIPDVYKTVVDEKKGAVKVRVHTAIPLTDDRLDNFRKQLDKITGKTAEIEIVHNPDILGGMIVHIGNRLIDGSVANRLKNLRAKLLSVHAG